MVGLRRCARGKCVQRVANRIVMVVSKWLWAEISLKIVEQVEVSIEK